MDGNGQQGSEEQGGGGPPADEEIAKGTGGEGVEPPTGLRRAVAAPEEDVEGRPLLLCGEAKRRVPRHQDQPPCPRPRLLLCLLPAAQGLKA